MIDFACMANEGYLQWAELCVNAIHARYPDAAVHLFDLTEQPRNALHERLGRHPAVRYLHYPPAQWTWPAWIDAMDFDFIWPRFGLRDALKYHSRRLRQALGRRNENWMTDKDAHTERARRALRLFAQKPEVIRRARLASQRNLVFIDVDALVLKPIDEVFELEFDLAVTAEAPEDVVIGPEPPECIERPPYPYKAINVGVIFVRDSARVAPLLDAWVGEMERVRNLSIEQTALANLVHRLAPDFFEAHYRKHVLQLDSGAQVAVMAVPMALYNFTRIQRGDERLAPGAKVAHFCGGKKQEQHWDWVRDMIARELDNPRV